MFVIEYLIKQQLPQKEFKEREQQRNLICILLQYWKLSLQLQQNTKERLKERLKTDKEWKLLYDFMHFNHQSGGIKIKKNIETTYQ